MHNLRLYGGGKEVPFLMGYLTLNTAAEFVDITQVVISFWFRIPLSSAVGGQTIPLLMMGPQQSTALPSIAYHVFPDTPSSIGGVGCSCAQDPSSGAGYGWWTGSYEPYLQGPTILYVYIPGVYGGGTLPGQFGVNIQTWNLPSLVSYFFGVDPSTPCGTIYEPCAWAFNDPRVHDTYVVDQSAGYQAMGDVFGGECITGAGSLITPEHWHHVLLSWDISGGSAGHSFHYPYSVDELTVDAASKMWCAVDDQNLLGGGSGWGGYPNNDLPAESALAATDLPGSWGYNDIVSGWTTTVCRSNGPIPPYPNTTAVTGGGNVPGLPVSIPGPAFIDTSVPPDIDTQDLPINYFLNSSPVAMVEMAEMQIWTGMTLDTTTTGARRLFVDSSGAPVDPSVAAAALGRTQAVLLAGKSSEWIGGFNQGTAGNFGVFGTINAFTPGPKIGA